LLCFNDGVYNQPCKKEKEINNNLINSWEVEARMTCMLPSKK
jgi:hypothetical protein